MKQLKTITIFSMVALLAMSLIGCGSKADEDITVADAKAEAEKMDVEQLKAKAMAYKDAIVAKKADVEKVMAKIKEIPPMEAMGEDAKSLKAEVDKINESISNLKAIFQVYYDKLKEKGGDISGLAL